MFCLPLEEDSSILLNIAKYSGAFSQHEEADELIGSVLQAYHAGDLDEGHSINVMSDKGKIVAWSYFAPNATAPDVWDVWWFGVDLNCHRQGYGHRLLKNVEKNIQDNNGRIIVIETSTTEALSKARNFYTKEGYKNCGTIPNFYGKNDGKVIFAKTIE